MSRSDLIRCPDFDHLGGRPRVGSLSIVDVGGTGPGEVENGLFGRIASRVVCIGMSFLIPKSPRS